MYNPTLRLLTILELLQTGEGMSGSELARRLEVEGRSVRRYITMLQDLGIPVEASRGRHGIYRLRPGFKLPPLMLTGEEALAVILGLLLIQTRGLAFATPSVEGATAKIARVLPAHLRERIQVLRQVVEMVPHLDFDATPTRGELILQLSEAVHARRQVWLAYCSEKGQPTERRLDPYGLAHWGGRWYTVGFCHLRQGLRAFRLDRITTLALQPEQFEAPPDFDCTDYLLRSVGATSPAWEVVVIFEPDSLSYRQQQILQTYGSTATGEGGRLVYRTRTDDLAETARFLVDFRSDFTVIQPPELNSALRDLAEAICRLADKTAGAALTPPPPGI